ncbi:MAG: exo-alpha-sialidase [Sphingobacteriales bacterium]|jgi:sialidase-1
MYRFIQYVFFTGLFIPLSIFAQNQPVIKVKATAPVAPLIREQTRNVFLHLAIYTDSTGFTVDALHFNFNKKAHSLLDSIFIYQNVLQPNFDPKANVQGFAPAEKCKLDGIMLNPGYTYLWVAVKLKPNVSLDGNIDMHVTSLSVNPTSRIEVEEVGGGFSKKIGTAVRSAWDDGVHTYRIPGMAITDKKTLIAVYDIRYKHSGDLPANVDVGMSRSTDGGNTWEPMKIIMDMGEPHDNNGVGDPAIVFDPISKKLFVVALWSKGNRSIAGSGPGLTPDETGQLVIAESHDDGLTWTKPVSITPQVKDPAWKLFFQGPGNGMVMKNGTIVFAAQYWDKAHMPHATIIYSIDRGKNWKRGVAAKSNTTEAQVEELQSGTLMLSMRDNRGKYRSVATTSDMGQTWLEHPTSYNTLEDPICMAGFTKANVQTREGLKDILFFSNPNSSLSRINMSIRASKDFGDTWPYSLLIDERSSFGYSVMVRLDEKTIGLLYEGIRDLYFVRVPVKEIVR